MPKLIDMTGERFGRLVVIERAETFTTKGGKKKTMWLCLCDCGQTKPIAQGSLKSGRTKSCGCLTKDVTSATRTTHGKRKTKIYGVWSAMKNRCLNTNTDRFRDYGGRGITVCQEWKDSFEAFYNYVSQLPHFGEKGYTLDRINNNGNYEPGNVRWATKKEQANNTRKVQKNGIKN